MGINGASGWQLIGSVDKTQFPGLASIAANSYVDVYVDWTPNFSVSTEDMAQGRLAFHTCIRVKLNKVWMEPFWEIRMETVSRKTLVTFRHQSIHQVNQ